MHPTPTTPGLDDPFRPVVDESTWARVAITGPAGAGKTYTSLLVASALAGDQPFAAVDTERRRMLAYRRVFGKQLRHFAPPAYDPRTLIKLIGRAAHHRYPVLVIDSLSAYWSGREGALEFVDSFEQATGGKFSAGWSAYRPIEHELFDAILAYPGHVIATLRVRTAYEIIRDESGKPRVVKLGLRPEQREGIDYEFDLVLQMQEAVATVAKSNKIDGLPPGRVIHHPGAEVAQALQEWSSASAPAPDLLELRSRALATDDVDALRNLLTEEVRPRLLSGAPVLDENESEVVTLEAMISRRGARLKAAAEQARRDQARAERRAQAQQAGQEVA